PIHGRAGEERIVCRGQPVGEEEAAIDMLREVGRPCAEGVGGDRRLRPRMGQIGPLLHEDRLAAAGERLSLNAREEAGEGEVILLAPAVGGMMVTLGALDADAEKELAERPAHLLGRLQRLVERGRPLVADVAARREYLAYELIVGAILSEPLPKPAREGD